MKFRCIVGETDRVTLAPWRFGPGHLRAILAAIGMMVCTLPVSASAQTDAPIVTAIWQTQNLSLDYYSSTVRYSCAGLRSRIGYILRAVGARESVVVHVECNRASFATNARAQIVVTTPVEATEENVRRATDFESRDRLVARMRQFDLPSANDIQRFPAVWRKVALSRDRRLDLSAGDCELLRGMREQIFPKLSVRMTKSSSSCTPGAATRVQPTFEVVALVPVAPLAQIVVAGWDRSGMDERAWHLGGRWASEEETMR